MYVAEQGAVVHKNRARLIVRKEGRVLEAVHLEPLEQVVLLGYIQITPAATHTLLQRGIDTVYLSKNGRYRGRLQSFAGKNIELRLAQFARSAEATFLVDLAKRMVQGKIQNMRLVLRRQQQRVRSERVESALTRMRGSLHRLTRSETLDEVRGVEGSATAMYFEVLSEVITNPSIPFLGRSRRPPRDPFNALLSFGYGLLLGTVETALQVVGLDPFLGSLHTPDNGKPSLVLDLMEEFRPLFVDSLMLAAVNRKQIHPQDFRTESVDFSDPSDARRGTVGVLLRRESIKHIVELYEQNLQRTLVYGPSGLNLTMRQICLEQARRLARHYQGREPYEAFSPR